MNPPPSQAQIENDAVLFYEGRHYYLSNFSAFQVEWGGRLWMTSEHAYQAAKFILAERLDIAEEIYQATSAHDAKQIARAHQREIPTWSDELKLATMREIVVAKLAQHPYIQKKLRQTGDAILIEDSPYDAFWGRGPDWDGLNQLGQIWMSLRATLPALSQPAD